MKLKFAVIILIWFFSYAMKGLMSLPFSYKITHVRMLISNNFGKQRVFEFKVCSCIIDLTFFGIKKFDSIENIIELAKDRCHRHLFNVFLDDSYIVCCKICLVFAAKSGAYLYNDCSRVCPNEAAADPNSINCIDLFEYGFEGLYVGCLNIVSCFSIKNLHTVK